MPRISSRRSEASENDLDGIAEQELVRLQQEYRVMEGDRKAYSEESQNTIRKQREAIATLQAENEELMKEFRLAGSYQNQTNDGKNIEKLKDLLKVEGELKTQVQEVKENISKQEQEIHKTERRTAQQRKHMGGLYMSHAKYVVLHKQIRMLENRLDQASKKFNQGLAENKNLREDIDHMRTERTIFQNLYKKLEKKRNENKEATTKVIEESTAAYDARDDAQNKMIVLKEKSDKELLQYNMDLKELMRIIDHDKKLKEFMNIKSEDRAEMHGFSLHYASKRGEERDKASDKDETILSYEAAFNKIKETTSIDDLHLLVGKFIETEDRNFALFNYVNELNNDIELLQEQIADIKTEIKQFNEESLKMDEQRQCILDDMEEKCAKTNEEISVHTKASEEGRKILTELKEGINSLFSKISCNPSTLVDMLGGYEGITDSNMMQYLGIIEQRTNELIQVQAFITSQDSDDALSESVGLLGKGPLPISTSVPVHPPATMDDYDSDLSVHSDEENRPLSQEEIKQRIMKGISKREDISSGKEKDRVSSSGSNSGERASTRKTLKKSPMKEK